MSPDDYKRSYGAGHRASVVSADRPRVGPVRSQIFDGLTDPALGAFLAGDYAGVLVSGMTRRSVLRNASVARCVFLIANAVGMLPLQLMQSNGPGMVAQAVDHPLHDLLALRPNNWQTAFEFKRLMQQRVLLDGNAYALPIRSRGAVRELIPIDPWMVTPKQRDDWSVFYEVRRKAGGTQIIERADMFHVMGPSQCGLRGMSLIEYAGEVLGLSLQAQRAAAKMFTQGVLAGGALSTDQKLSEEAIGRLKASLSDEFMGAENAGKWMVLEQGLSASAFSTGKDSQNIEQRAHQVEEIARLFGVPRPFLMVDDTSWGTGIEQLGIFFVQYGLSPHLVAWEQAIDRVLLTDVERKTLYPKFNERALLRGSMKDQAEFFAKALGSGGSRAWMTQDEIRGLSDLAPKGGEADALAMGITAHAGAQPAGGKA